MTSIPFRPAGYSTLTPFLCVSDGAAAEHGATVREQPSTFVTGDRFASVLDPYGHRWSIMTRIEEVSDAEAERRVAEWAATEVSG